MDEERISLRAFLSGNNTEEELRRLIAHFADTAKYIADRLREPIIGELKSKNAYGETQKKLDVWADEKIEKKLSQETTFGVKGIASEEGGEIKNLKTRANSDGRYSVTVDPLDGSSLIDKNLSIGTIFGIYEGKILDDEKPARDRMRAAMYFLSGPATTMMLTAGRGTHQFLLNRVGTWVLD